MPPRGPSTCRRVIFCQPLRDESQIGTAWIFLLERVGCIFVSASSRARLVLGVTGRFFALYADCEILRDAAGQQHPQTTPAIRLADARPQSTASSCITRIGAPVDSELVNVVENN